MLFEQALHGGVAALEVGKGEELAHEGEEIVALHLPQLVGRGLLFGDMLGETEHGAVLDDGGRRNGGAEHETFERFATREGHIRLTVGESALHVDDGALEGEALTLVDGDGPCGAEGILREGAVDHFLDLIGTLIEDVSRIVPRFARHVDEHSALVGAHRDFIVLQTHHFAQHAIEIMVFTGRAVADEHDLRPAFERQALGGGIGTLGEFVFHLRIVGECRRGEGCHLCAIDGIGLMIVRHEAHISLPLGRAEVGDVACVEPREEFCIDCAVAHGIEEVEKIVVGLAIDGLQLNGDERCLLQRVTREEVFGIVVARQQFAVFVLDHGRKLLQIADEQQLHATERAHGVAITAQSGVDTVEQVGTHHRDLVDDDEIEAANEPLLAVGHAKLVGAKLHAGNEGGKGQLQERMDGDSAGVDGGNARGGEHHHAFVHLFANLSQKGGFTGAGSSGEKEVGVGILDDLARQIAFGIFH